MTLLLIHLHIPKNRFHSSASVGIYCAGNMHHWHVVAVVRSANGLKNTGFEALKEFIHLCTLMRYREYSLIIRRGTRFDIVAAIVPLNQESLDCPPLAVAPIHLHGFLAKQRSHHSTHFRLIPFGQSLQVFLSRRLPIDLAIVNAMMLHESDQ